MKKLLLFSSICLLPSYILHAQISLGQWDVAMPLTVIQVAHDTLKPMNPGSINPGPAGASQVWNFSTLAAHTVDTFTFTNPNWLPNASNFPNSNLAFLDPSTSSENYLRNDASGLYIEGLYGDPFGVGAMPVKFSDPEQLAQWTDTYGNSFQDTGIAGGDFPFSQFPGVDSARFKHTVIKTVTTDGWGNITIPLGTYPCLRHSGKVNTTDSIWLHNVTPPGWFDVTGQFIPEKDSMWHFSWWGSNMGYALLEFDSTAADTIRNIAFLNAPKVIGSVVEASPSASVSVYPNPAVNEIYFSISKGAINTIEVYDLSGSKIASLDAAKKNNISFNTVALAGGTYFYRTLDEKGNMTDRGKFETIK